jgi:hypothetical protein
MSKSRGALIAAAIPAALPAVNRRAVAIAYLLLSLGCLSASGQEGGGVMLTISNDTSDNLLVTIYDLGSSPRQQVLSSRALYGNASITISITQDASGKGHLWWTAMNLDRDMRKCGHDDKANLNDGDTVNVYVDSDCSG